jgi:microcystin degradation protein MlrC
MRIFTAGLVTETNTFAPWPTGLAGFEEGGLFRGDASASGDDSANVAARLFGELARADGHDFAEGLFATAHPSGPTLKTAYEALRDEIVDDIRARDPFDIVLLFLHGAMVADGYDDCEADLARRVRAVIGDKAVIGVELDPHCHLSQDLIDASDCVILMKEYPHIDFAERARELYDICTRAAAGTIKPTSALFDCRMLGFYPTTIEPMAGFVRRFKQTETEPGVLSVSFAHGFPWGDTPNTGSRMLVVTDNDPALAAEKAKTLGMAIYAERETLRPRMPTIAEALDMAASMTGLVVLGDGADNPGGGAPGDNTAFLREMVRRGVTGAVLGCIRDPMAVRTCMEAGVGAVFTLRIGGKSGAASNDPLDLRVEVKALKASHDQTALAGARSDLGPSAWVACGGIDIVLMSERTQTYAPDAFTGIGIDLAGKRLLVVKSTQHYKAGFAAVSDQLINVAGDGAIQMRFEDIDYRKFDATRMFPVHPDPLAGA